MCLIIVWWLVVFLSVCWLLLLFLRCSPPQCSPRLNGNIEKKKKKCVYTKSIPMTRILYSKVYKSTTIHGGHITTALSIQIHFMTMLQYSLVLVTGDAVCCLCIYKLLRILCAKEKNMDNSPWNSHSILLLYGCIVLKH